MINKIRLKLRGFINKFNPTPLICHVKLCLNYNHEKNNCWFVTPNKGYEVEGKPRIFYTRFDFFGLYAICKDFRPDESIDMEDLP